MSRLQSRYVFDWDRIFNQDEYHLEYSVTDSCNRNCVACSHLAPLAKFPNYVNIGEFTRVTNILHECLPNIHTFWITGGEPMLHPDFMRLLEIARHIYREAYIGIYSNGLILHKYEHDYEFWQYIRDNGIVWGITIYDGKRQYYEELFDRNGCINNLAIVRSGGFFTNLTNYSQRQPISKEKYKACGWERCKINIRNGRIFNCPASEFVDLFNEFFGINLVITEHDYLLVNDALTVERIKDFKKPIPFCEQCDLTVRGNRVFLSSVSKRAICEWADADLFMQTKG